MGTVRSLLADLREVATRERTEGTSRRRPGDAARAAVATLVLVPLVLHAHHPTATEQAVVRLFEAIPHGARTLFLVLYQLAALWAVGLLAFTVLLLRRWRLARDLAVAAGGAWVLGRLLAFLVHDSGRRARGGRRRGLGAGAARGLPGPGLRPVRRVPRDVRAQGGAAFPDGAPQRGGGGGARGVTAPPPADPAHRRGPCRPPGAVEPVPVARVPHRPHRRDRARLGCGTPRRVGVRHSGRTAGGRAGGGRARRAGRRRERGPPGP